MKGTVSYPNSFIGKPLKGPFNKLKKLIAINPGAENLDTVKYLKVINTFKPRFIYLFNIKNLSYDEPKREWSFYVNYMDKNRPLPRGTAFDPYRQKDFERRKAEGFPKPLYPSKIKTPEATKEQQKEPERIGRGGEI